LVAGGGIFLFDECLRSIYRPAWGRSVGSVVFPVTPIVEVKPQQPLLFGIVDFKL